MNKKVVSISEYISMFKPFYMSRDLASLTYTPSFYCIFNKKDSLTHFNKLMLKYTNLSDIKKTINLFDYSKDINQELKKENALITFTLDQEYKDDVNFYIEDVVPENDIYNINQFFFNLRDKCNGFALIVKEETFNKIFQLSLRTYSDFIFVDDYIKNIFENCGSKIASPYTFGVEFTFENKMLCFDKTTNWIEFKILKI